MAEVGDGIHGEVAFELADGSERSTMVTIVVPEVVEVIEGDCPWLYPGTMNVLPESLICELVFINGDADGVEHADKVEIEEHEGDTAVKALPEVWEMLRLIDEAPADVDGLSMVVVLAALMGLSSVDGVDVEDDEILIVSSEFLEDTDRSTSTLLVLIREMELLFLKCMDEIAGALSLRTFADVVMFIRGLEALALPISARLESMGLR